MGCKQSSEAKEADRKDDSSTSSSSDEDPMELFKPWNTPCWLRRHQLDITKMASFANVAYDVDRINAPAEENAELSTVTPGSKQLDKFETKFHLKKAYSFGDLQFTIFQKRNNRQVILAFRGTTDSGDWQTNLDSSLVPWKSVGKEDLEVHEGFSSQYAAGRDQILSDLKQLEENGMRRLLVCGHSLGGALTTLAALDLCDQFEKLKISAVTFGSPRVGGEAFVKAYGESRVGKRTVRVVNAEPGALLASLMGNEGCIDKVSCVPTEDMGYRHVVPARYVNIETDRNVLAGSGMELELHSCAEYEHSSNAARVRGHGNE